MDRAACHQPDPQVDVQTAPPAPQKPTFIHLGVTEPLGARMSAIKPTSRQFESCHQDAQACAGAQQSMTVQPRPVRMSSSPAAKTSLRIARHRRWVGRVIAT